MDNLHLMIASMFLPLFVLYASVPLLVLIGWKQAGSQKQIDRAFGLVFLFGAVGLALSMPTETHTAPQMIITPVIVEDAPKQDGILL